MKKVLVTGAYGFLGRYTAKKFSENGYHVTGLGHGKWNEHGFKKWGVSNWVSSTITFETLINLNQAFDVIVHCGGSGSVAYSYENPYEDFQKSVQSTLSLLEYIRLKCPAALFIYASSPAVLGDLGERPISEDDPSNPVSPYGFHKKAAEELCQSYVKSFGLNIDIIRFFSIYGAGLQKQLLWDACMKIEQSSGKIDFFGTGEETRDWVNITDATNLILLLSDTNNRQGLNIYNCGSGKKTTIAATIGKLVELYGKNVEINFNQTVKPGDPRFYHADVSKSTAIGWVAQVDLTQGFRQYVEYFKRLMND